MVTIGAYFSMMFLRGKRVTFFGNMDTLTRTHHFHKYNVSLIVLVVKIVVVVLLYMLATNSIETMRVQPKTTTEYMLIIDSSASMSNNDLKPSRIEAAKILSEKWLSIMPDKMRVGLISFSETIDSSVPVTSDKKKVLESIKNIKVDYSKSGTDLDYAINQGIEYMSEDKDNKSMLIFTDGTQEIRNSTIDKAISKNIKIYSFGIGSESVSLKDVPEAFKKDYEESLELNFDILKDISKRTGGESYRISSTEELELKFRTATLEQVKVNVNSGYYVAIFIALLSIAELLIYSKIGAV